MASIADQKDSSPTDALALPAVDTDATLDFGAIAHYAPGTDEDSGERGGLWSQHMVQWLASDPPAAESLAPTAGEDAALGGEADIAITGQSTSGGEST